MDHFNIYNEFTNRFKLLTRRQSNRLQFSLSSDMVLSTKDTLIQIIQNKQKQRNGKEYSWQNNKTRVAILVADKIKLKTIALYRD